LKPSGTTVLYVAKDDGSDARCIGCADVIDGVDGQRIFAAAPAGYAAAPSTTTTPNPVTRRTGAVIYANQNKDLAYWTPDGKWLLAGVEMPRHALTHDQGNSAAGMFNDLWAISVDGKTWVQLTDFASTWQMVDLTAGMPFPSINSVCTTGLQYASKQRPTPFHAYFCSLTGAPPPSIGTMRPTIGKLGGELVVAWAERVGLDPAYTASGVLQLAMAGLKFSEDGLPALVNYKRNLTPAPGTPHAAENLWKNPGGMTEIGNLYEPWSFSADGKRLAFASDVFRSTSVPGSLQPLGAGTASFMDVVEWKWMDQPAALEDMTRHDALLYPYLANGTPTSDKHAVTKTFGHWEEPAVYMSLEGWEHLAFASSANLSPAWNPLEHNKTFGLETWVMAQDRTSPARKVTSFNTGPGPRWLVYPTDAQGYDGLLLSVVPAGQPGGNPPGSIYRLQLAH
jgi:hypothetical protein